MASFAKSGSSVPTEVIAVHRGDDNRMWWARGSLNADSQMVWSGDKEFGRGNRTGSGVALAWHKGTLFCVHPGSDDDNLWWCTWDAEAQDFTEDQKFPNHKSDMTVALYSFDGNLFCVHRGRNGDYPNDDPNLYCATWNEEEGNWNGDTRMSVAGNQTDAGPALIEWNRCLFCVYRATGLSCALYSCRFTGSGWTEGKVIRRDKLDPESYSTVGLYIHDTRLICIHRGKHTDSKLWMMKLIDAGGYLIPEIDDKPSGNLASAGPALYQLGGKLYALHKGDDANLWYCAVDDATFTLLPDTMIPGSLIQDEPGVAFMTAPT